ncbi:hypothetical protein HER21_37890, partial [Pseudomonas sp. BGM005]|nr:hypothetical protein [Pseudomonas sp. BG5]
DLAALPTYTRNRDFDGFRGFGVVRLSDAQEDPLALGQTLGQDGVGHDAASLGLIAEPAAESAHDVEATFREAAAEPPVADANGDDAPAAAAPQAEETAPAAETGEETNFETPARDNA